jgi:hypothetical protein
LPPLRILGLLLILAGVALATVFSS